MHLVPESVAAELVSIDDAITVIRQAFVDLHLGRAEVFPVVIGTASDPANRFALKSARIGTDSLGVKVGTYWPGNVARGQVAHGSTVLLLDDATGYPSAVVGASHLTALRTAAADAVAVDALAPAEARTLLVIGTGHQAYHEAIAVSRVRELDEVMVWGRSSERAEHLAADLASVGLPASAESLDEALARAEIVVTVTSSQQPIVPRAGLRPGVHISAMGADTPGKQELDLDVARGARLVADVPAQSVVNGELQHLAAAGEITPSDIVALGAVLCGDAIGRDHPEQLTVFDSSGTAIQDLAICSLAVRLAVERGRALEVS